MATLTASLVLLTACGTDTVMVKTSLAGDEPFVRVARSALSSGSDGGTNADGYVSGDNESFYLAINKSQLGQRWFLSAYLTQWHPSQNIPVRTLGTKVVSFKVQNGKLFVFDTTDGKAWSDVLDPSVVVEAYPLVTDFAPFNQLTGSGNYVLFDPSAGLNRFDVVGDDLAASRSTRFQIDLSYLQRFRSLSDGISFDQVFTGYTETAMPGVTGFEQPFRGSGTVSIALRKYTDGAGFVSSELVSNNYFGSTNVQYVKNAGGQKQNAVKWNIKPGMQPIPWRLTKSIERLKADPRLAGIDIEGAFARGITGWNDAFGFQVFKVEPGQASDSFGDDDKNFVVIDTNPSMGFAFADWRENPNSGEIRGASVYFSSVFIEGAIQSAPVDVDGGTTDPFPFPWPTGDAGVGGTDGGSSCAAPTGLVLSAVFGGQSASGPRNQDYVELHNRGPSAVSLSGLSLQYASANGTAWQVVPLKGAIAAGGFYLVGFAAVSDGGVALPTVDQTSQINLSSGSGKVALTTGTTPLTGACPGVSTDGGFGSAALIDFLGYGSANCSEAMMPAPMASIASAVVRSDVCVDDDINSFDFALQPPNPHTSASAPVACGCTSTGPTGPGTPHGSADGGTTIIAQPHALVAPSLRWSSLKSPTVCALPPHPKKALTAGLTRKDFIEKIITHTLLHEIGHTLGLRHNFKGSFTDSSVMDYLRDEDAVLLSSPGTYDVAAVKFLYGLSPFPPSSDFCTDEDTVVDSACAQFDAKANPLTDDATPAFKRAARSFISAGNGLSYWAIWGVSRFVRAPKDDAQRIEALNALMSDVAPPLSPEVLALSPTAAAHADYLAALLLQNLFTSTWQYRDEITLNPAMTDPAFAHQVAAMAKNIMINSDGHRSLDTRYSMVAVLKEMQSVAAYQALVSGRAALVTERAGYTPEDQALIDDLIRRIDLANSPYFR